VAKVTFEPEADSQNASVVVELSDGQVVAVSRGYRELGDTASGVGDGIYFDGLEARCRTGALPTSAATVHLMLRKAGNSYVGYYRPAEGDWIEVGRCSNLTAEPATVGLAVTNGAGDADSPEIPAEFDSFTLVRRK
jgi:hypothetical protein